MKTKIFGVLPNQETKKNKKRFNNSFTVTKKMVETIYNKSGILNDLVGFSFKLDDKNEVYWIDCSITKIAKVKGI